ncbi:MULTISPECIES: hypothetical protein [Acinetobacter]|jgi:hypothetical protein|uniref:hypothetical protein n=1 Tax=Acinetobacter TaxID=469 RepID=UPI000D010994|nr:MULTISPECIES: hypothetical protein [Acinetobacter]QLD61475.1 hypothetical protein CQZ96_009405 [Acinetobacter sp. MYb10]
MKNINIFLCLLLCIFLAACSKKSDESASQSQTEATSADAAAEAANNQVAADEKLGTKWGDEIDSHVTEVQLKRKSDSPLAETIVQYADKNYKGKTINSISIAAGKVSFSVVDDRGNRIPIYRVGQSYYLSGREGQSYQLQYENNTAKTFEVVASVDGVDVIDGSEASRSNSGYVLHAHDSLKIEGFRKSESAVASFTFSKPKDAYAANSENGSIQNAGVIGTVLYELEAPEDEAKPVSKYAPPPNAFPADR